MDSRLDHVPFLSSLNCEHTCHRKELYPLLASASIEQPQDFADSTLKALISILPLKAASFYSYNPDSQTLRLKSQVGLDYEAYSSFELPLDTLAGRCVSSLRPVIEKDLPNAPGYRDSALVERYGLHSFVAVPLLRPLHYPEYCPNPIGVICCYPQSRDILEQIAGTLVEAAPFVGRLYLAALDAYKMALRSELVARAAYSTEIGGLLHRSLQVLQQELRVEGASAFLLDERNNFLRLRGSTRLQKGLRKEQVFFLPDSADPTVQALGSPIPMFPDPKLVMPLELTESKLSSCLLLSLRQPAWAPNQSPRRFGVLRLVNKRLISGGRNLPGSFSWEDVVLADFVAEMLSVLISVLTRRSATEFDYERMMHGARNNLNAAIQSLELLEQRGSDALASLPKGLSYLVSNAIAFISDIRSQVVRMEFRDSHHIPVRSVNLYGEVLSKLPGMISRSARAYEVDSFDVTNLQNAGFAELPPVAGDVDALMTVFRNLVENAVKYSGSARRSNRIEFSARVEGRFLVIRVSDNGIGIPPADRGSIFIEGFRATNAMARQPYGMGLGLRQSREIMLLLSGDLNYLPNESSTSFEVSIPIYKDK